MVKGVGIDIVDIERVAKALESHGGRMRNRIFTAEEQAYCDARHTPPLHYAARFAAKEAFSKAVGTGLTTGLGWKDMWIRNLRSGEPVMEVSERGREAMGRRGAARVHVSLSHTATSAAAVVVIED